jgi:hypothetical protein
VANSLTKQQAHANIAEQDKSTTQSLKYVSSPTQPVPMGCTLTSTLANANTVLKGMFMMMLYCHVGTIVLLTKFMTIQRSNAC